MLAAANCTGLEPRPEPSLVEATLPRVLTVLSFVLEKLVARNDRLLEGLSRQLNGLSSHGSATLGKSLNGFHGVRPPCISIPKYLERIYKYTGCSPSCFVVGFVYIDRLVHKHPGSLVVSLNVHRLLVTSVMVASKMLDDEFKFPGDRSKEAIEICLETARSKAQKLGNARHYNNAFYARVGGVSNSELNRLEMELLFLLDFGVVVSSRAFESYCSHLERELLLNGYGGHGKIDKALVLPDPALDDATEPPPPVEDAQATADPPSLPQVVY